MTKPLLTLLTLVFAALAPSAVYAQMGWTKQQVEAKYGKPDSTFYTGYTFDYKLSPQKFPLLNANGYDHINMEYYKGKVVVLTLQWRGPETKRGTMSYDTAKSYALSYMDPNPDRMAIKGERHQNDSLGVHYGESGGFTYKEWQFGMYYDKQQGEEGQVAQFTISPAANTPLAKEWAAFQAQSQANAQAKSKAQSDSQVRRETR